MAPVTSFRDTVIAMYNARPAYIKAKEVAAAIGKTPAWLSLFSNGKIPNPGIVTVETLHKYLKDHNASV